MHGTNVTHERTCRCCRPEEEREPRQQAIAACHPGLLVCVLVVVGYALIRIVTSGIVN